MLQIAMLQMAPDGVDQEANRRKADAFCRRAAAMGADIAVMPEMWNIGYTGPEDGSPATLEAWKAQAVPADGAFVNHFAALAAELNMAIVVAYLEETPAGPRNAATLIDRHGEKLYTYAKVHTCMFSTMEAICENGEAFFTAPLDTAKGAVQVGTMICYDREHPESARILMLQGAEIVLTPNACHLDDLRIHQFKTRAFENAMVMVLVNYARPRFDGHSAMFDADGEHIVLAGQDEGIYMGAVDLDRLRAYRANTIWGAAFRRPKLYEQLTDTAKPNVFERRDALDRPFNP